jgi:hypothetical protein
MKALKIDHEVGRRIWMGLVSRTTATVNQGTLASIEARGLQIGRTRSDLEYAAWSRARR